MSLNEILTLPTVGFLFFLFAQGPFRGWLILIASVICLFWLQPSVPIRYFDFWLPLLTLWGTCFVWLVTFPKNVHPSRSDAFTGILIIVLILAIGFTRYLNSVPFITASLPPTLNTISIRLLIGLLLFFIFFVIRKKTGGLPAVFFSTVILILITLLIFLKAPVLTLLLAKGLRLSAGQNPELATAFDIRWIGFSYIAFRLIHTLRDRLSGKLQEYDLRTFVNYIIFFPSIVAGPIDRIERFAGDYRKSEQPILSTDIALAQSASNLAVIGPPIRLGKIWSRFRTDDVIVQACQLLILGLFKKFVLADTLALIALNPTNALQVQAAGWLWLLTYFYAFQIYFDFAGYTDIAIGLGLLLGVRLPDNFSAPYRKTNLTLFWNAWHISLTQWLRVYLFNPLVRSLRSKKMPAVTVLLIGQVVTMLVIGLWHGITWNYLIWGLWHGLGQFIQNRWSDWVKPWFASRTLTPIQTLMLRWINIGLTFNYVALGWVWFLLPSPDLAVQVFQRLFGIRFN